MTTNHGNLVDDLSRGLETHTLYVAIVGLGVIVGVVLTLMVIADVRRNRADRAAHQSATAAHSEGIAEGFRRGYHGGPKR